jgi:hypothetical protein
MIPQCLGAKDEPRCDSVESRVAGENKALAARGLKGRAEGFPPTEQSREGKGACGSTGVDYVAGFPFFGQDREIRVNLGGKPIRRGLIPE